MANRARSRVDGAPKLSADQAKARIIDLLDQGKTVEEACRVTGKSPRTYEYYKSSDKDFCDRANLIMERRRNRKLTNPTPIGEFAEFRPRYLGQKVFAHQQQWIDLLEGNEPRDLHPAMTYEPGSKQHLIINTPPEHAKSTTITVDYVTYRICKDPNVRVIVVSKTQEMAKQFLYAIKTRLTHPRYKDLQLAFAPADGYKATADAWTSDKVYLGQDARDSGEKDPTVQALGIGQQIYGARADLIIIDDAIVLSNASEYEKQLDWLQQEVLTRLGPTGVLLVVGTRVASIDLYRELRNGERYPTGVSPWAYFAQPAVLEFHEDPEKWVTLWPRSDHPWPGTDDQPDAEGHYARWDGKYLAQRRNHLKPSTWAMVYMQQDVVPDAVFKQDRVNKAVQGARATGPLRPGAPGHPDHGEGFYIIGGLDPATAGHTAAVVLAVDRSSAKRYVLDIFDEAGQTPAQIKGVIKDWTLKYGIQEWRVENVAFAQWVVTDEDLKNWLAARGVILKGHTTGSNKWDPDFGVASMATLFDSEPQLIELPSTRQNEATRRFVEQLITWAPKTKNKTDIVMALWFAEIRAREITQAFGGKTHLDNKFLSRRQRQMRMVVNLDAEWHESQGGGLNLGFL